MKMTSIVILVTPLLALVGTAVAVMTVPGRAGIVNPGAHGFSEVLYAFRRRRTTTAAPLPACPPTRRSTIRVLALVMWFGRFAFIVPVLAIAGSLARKKRIESTVGTLPTHGALFIAMLVGTVVLVGALTYVPALALGSGDRAAAADGP